MNERRARIFGRLRAERAPASRLPVLGSGSPSRDGGEAERLVRFKGVLESARGEICPVGADWPRALFERLRAEGARHVLYGPQGPHGAALERGWPDDGSVVSLDPYVDPIERCRGLLFGQADAGLTSCRGAIAETGAIVLWPDVREPRLLSLIPPIHVVLLQVSEIHSSFAELMARQGWSQGMPTNALLIGGPSKSADIEQTLTYGVHGPGKLIVLLRTDEAEAGAGVERQV